MVTRALTGSLIVATILGGIYYDRSSFVGLFFVITTFGLWEFYTLAEKGGMAPQKTPGHHCRCRLFCNKLDVHSSNDPFGLFTRDYAADVSYPNC